MTAEAQTKMGSAAGSRAGDSRHSNRGAGSQASGAGSNEVPYQGRMKVNINSQAVADGEHDNSYVSTAIGAVGIGGQGAQLMQPQVVQMSRPPADQRPTLEESIAQNNRKVVGASSIRTLIKSAATRD